MKKFWAYRYKGKIRLFRYRDSRKPVDDAYSYQFVTGVLEPFYATSWSEAKRKAKLGTYQQCQETDITRDIPQPT